MTYTTEATKRLAEIDSQIASIKARSEVNEWGHQYTDEDASTVDLLEKESMAINKAAQPSTNQMPEWMEF